VALGVGVLTALSNIGSQFGIVAANLPTARPRTATPGREVSPEREVSPATDGRLAAVADPDAPPGAVLPAGLPEAGDRSGARVVPSHAPPDRKALAAEHEPADPAAAMAVSDAAQLRQRLEVLLASDPTTLTEVRALLDERDPQTHARNLQLLQESFALE
jgi:hypothetical protein